MMGWSLGRYIEQFNILSRGRCGPVLVSSPQTMINCATGFDTSAKIEKRWRIELLSKTKRSDVKARKEDTKIWTETNCWMNSGLDFTGSFPFFSIFYCGFKPWNFNFKVFSFLPTFFSYQVSDTVVISSYNVHQPQDHVKKKFHPPKLVIVTLEFSDLWWSPCFYSSTLLTCEKLWMGRPTMKTQKFYFRWVSYPSYFDAW